MKIKLILDVQNPIMHGTSIQRVKVIDVCETGNPNNQEGLIEINTMIARGLPQNWISVYTHMLPQKGVGYYGLFFDGDNVILTKDIATVVDWRSTHNCECLVEIPDDNEGLDVDTMAGFIKIFEHALVGLNTTTKTYGEYWDGIDEVLEIIGKISTKLMGHHMRATMSFGSLKLTKQKE